GDDTFEVSVILHSPAIGFRVEVEVWEGDRIVARQGEEGGASYRLFIQIPDGKRWTPDAPHLYDFTIRLFDLEGRLQDEVQAYGGLRSIKVRGDRLLLNDQPIYLLMALDQGYWPDGNMTAASDDVLRRDVELAKEMGFNGVRKHQKVEDPRWLYWCDKLGLLVWGEMANARKWSLDAEEEFIAEWERVVRRDANHPSIVTWVPVNESWGVPGLRSSHPAQYSFLERVVALTRRLDPTRPIIDNDGWEHTDVSDIAAIHDYTPTGSLIEDRWRNGMPERIWHKNLLVHYLAGAQYRGQPIVLSEVGGLLMIPEDTTQLDRLYSVYGSIQTVDELLERYRELILGIARIVNVSGFCYTQLTDVEQEINGLLTYDRQPKVPLEEIAKIHREALSLVWGGS
ncbi:MAG TPA: glycoside hydrolase family 2 TIM barrel-domain containing protein, partial [Fimbriimonas sp.]